jgi:protein involved in polysaccharide export with SLBB domain
MKIIMTICTLICSVILFFGCSSYPKRKEVAPLEDISVLQKGQAVHPEPEVRLSPGDVLEIKFFYTPELNSIQSIRPDGKIALQLVGEVNAEGKTPGELKAELQSSYSKYVSQLDVTIVVQSLHNRKIFVGGQVETPGSVPMPGSLTVLEALMQAGGVTVESGKYDTVLVIRNVDGFWVGGKLNLDQILRGEEIPSYQLKPLDIVYVPETHISEVNRWVDQNINRIMPEIGIGWNFANGQLLGTTVGVTMNPRDSR